MAVAAAGNHSCCHDFLSLMSGLRFSWEIGTKDTYALLMPGNTAADYRPSNDWRDHM
jgi:hypothetical protein